MKIFNILHEKINIFAIQLGLAGIIFLFSSIILDELIMNPALSVELYRIIILFIEKIGELLIVAGFVSFILEKHNISQITEQLSTSIINEIINSYFTREKLLDFIKHCIKNLNKFEKIDDEIYGLYSEHGILELTFRMSFIKHNIFHIPFPLDSKCPTIHQSYLPLFSQHSHQV